MHKTNPDSLRSCLCFQVFRLNFASDFFNLLLVRFHLAEIILLKHLIQGATTRFGWELNHQPCGHGHCKKKNNSPNHSATLQTFFMKTNKKATGGPTQFLSNKLEKNQRIYGVVGIVAKMHKMQGNN